ncbi:MAG: aminotransferase class I/II-fold pyridoxal phosphate-dependent enzyme [Spirochaetaceae bacterium]|jgi:aspartate/methionine/tyrosine aminotransferase|nr:aminotransferase class I/II-fold pyridoxal phosphate-dependent enzyme [Spirochaetaceae bacterium]
MDRLAVELNALLSETVAGRLLSDFGRRIFFPKGIISQSAEAKQRAHRANATIGMACSNGIPLRLSGIARHFPLLSETESVAYAPTTGVEDLRGFWKEQILEKNPSLAAADFSTPVIVPGITAGISFAAELFVDSGQNVIASAPCWDNYALIFEQRRGARVRGTAFLDEAAGALNIDAIARAVRDEAKSGSVRVILNFPNNPAGYAPSAAEAAALSSLLLETAQGGADVLVLCDDAYFGLFYEDDTCKQSLFGSLAAGHERLLAVKIDGPTKEDYVWGLRLAALTFGCKGFAAGQYEALIKKLAGVIRSSVSCANTPSQYAYLHACRAEGTETQREKQQFFERLKKRYLAVKRFIATHEAPPQLVPLPFNSGYFMSFRTIGVGAEQIRTALLENYGVGTIAISENCLRLAFSSLNEDDIDEVYSALYKTAAALGGSACGGGAG